MTKTLVPVDGSEQSAHAAAWAAANCSGPDSSILLLHVFDLNAAEAMAMSHLTREEIAERLAAHAKPSFEKARAAMGSGTQIEELAVIGDPAEEIIGIAKQQGHDHIVMGSRGLNSLQELLLGSVSEKVIRRAHCAVTIMR
jgi:nucleotide-binding universal stress UspA family protein